MGSARWRRPAAVASKAARAALQRTARTRPDHVLFNSFTGQFSDSPRAIEAELLRRDCRLQHVWVSRGSGVPELAGRSTVDLSRIGDQRLIGAAKLIVANVEMPSTFQKRSGITYLQTWHGTPLKRLGRDRLDWAPGLDAHLQAREIAKWDLLISQNSYSTEIFRRAFRFEGRVLEVGLPRNDVLLSPERDEIRRRVRERLDVQPHQRAILYAPTYRDEQRRNDEFASSLDLDALARQLGPSDVVMLRLHYFLRDLAVRLGRNPLLRDVSAYPDIAELYLAADVLVTDYSSSIFDFAVTGKPIVIYAYDLDRYRDAARGLYFDIEREGPGAVCVKNDELVSALRDDDAISTDVTDRYDTFRGRFCHLEDGHATERVVDHLLSHVLQVT